MYSPQLLDHFEHPRNAGELTNPDAHVRVENPVCGDILELFAKVREGIITEVRFKAKGCVPAMACGSVITAMAKGKSLAEVGSISREGVADYHRLPATRRNWQWTHCGRWWAKIKRSSPRERAHFTTAQLSSSCVPSHKRRTTSAAGSAFANPADWPAQTCIRWTSPVL
jgi:NifU-like protein involved in Fe-S cluster formation